MGDFGADVAACAVPPEGWWCSRPAGHDGPCAARPTKEMGETIWAAAEAAQAKRAADMPAEQDAIDALFQAYQRLTELGWRNPIYCPKDGSAFLAIEAGSTGIHRCHYQGEWPKGSWWVEDGGDFWPSRPTLFHPAPPESDAPNTSQDTPSPPEDM